MKEKGTGWIPPREWIPEKYEKKTKIPTRNGYRPIGMDTQKNTQRKALEKYRIPLAARRTGKTINTDRIRSGRTINADRIRPEERDKINRRRGSLGTPRENKDTQEIGVGPTLLKLKTLLPSLKLQDDKRYLDYSAY